ncbi:actin cytoskeleton and mitosis protein [Recurvomyces mirabilis]|uniref:Actin cytoskeleton and mitosis protein n=1 Tax=Recurvomyces mirabilis TaxID=574656 RepID=A0AAE0WR86_9PEZI|nr:actin cytoskeleton and mitosis protein [Recurvomyces mirabilis]
MSSARGRGTVEQGRGRGTARGTSTTRGGGGSKGSASRGRVTGRRTFGSPSRGDATAPARGSFAAGSSLANTSNGFPFGKQSQQPGAFGGAQSKGNWAQRYEQLETSREQERAQAIRQGLIADPNKPRSLADAITPVGTCQGMCAEFERVQRVVQNDVWAEETDQNRTAYSIGNAQPDEVRFVKKFRRAAAGLEEQLPSDLRPPAILKKTCDYLFDEVIGQAPALEKVHHFVWDRTRAIRNDFSIQQVTRAEDLSIAIECYERIARFHIVSLHQLAVHPRPYDKYDAQQEREQLDRTLLSLMQYYDDSRGRVSLPNEAEFRAYCVIFQLQDPIPDMEDRAQSWPRQIMMDNRVRVALELYAAACNTMDAQGPLKPRANHLIAQQDFQRFWSIVESKKTSYLMACVAEIYFNLVRRTTLEALYRGFRQSPNRSTEDWTAEALRDLLAFDDVDQVFTFSQAYGFSFGKRADGNQYIDLVSVRGEMPQPNVGLPKQWRSEMVEMKRFGRTLPATISGMTVKQAREAGLMHAEENEDEMEDVDGMMDGTEQEAAGPDLDDGEGLFVPEVAPQQEQKKPTTFDQLVSNCVVQTSAATAPTSTAKTTDNSGWSFGKPSTNITGPSNATSSGPPGKLFDFTAAKAAALAVAPTAPASTPLPAFKPSPFQGSTFNFASAAQPARQTSPAFNGAQSVFDMPAATAPMPVFNFTGAPTSHGNGTDLPAVPALFQNLPQSTVESPPSSPDEASSISAQPPNLASATFVPDHAPASEPKIVQPSQPALTTSPKDKKASPASPASPAVHETPSISIERRASINHQHKPRVPSPLRKGSSFEDFRSAGNTTVSQPTAADIFDRLAREILEDSTSGFLRQYLEYTVSQTVAQTQAQVHRELVNKEADDFRRYILERRYGRRWREALWRRKSTLRAHARRQRARRGLEDLRSDKVSDMGSTMSRSRASTMDDAPTRPERVDKIFQQTVLDEIRPSQHLLKSHAAAGNKRSLSSLAKDAPPINGFSHKRQKSVSQVNGANSLHQLDHNSAQADLLRRSAYLAGSPPGQERQQSTTQTNYFRLKAMGIDPVAKMNEAERGRKRRRSDSVENASKTPSDSNGRSPILSLTAKASAPKSLMLPPPTTSAKKDDSDDALFARLKAAREALAESGSIVKDIVAKEQEMQKSLDASRSSNDSPSMMKARAEARWRASRPGSVVPTPELHGDVPAYRLRESRFVPREQYGKAIERSKVFRESRSCEISRPESRFDDTTFDQSVSDFVKPVSHSFAPATSYNFDSPAQNGQQANGLAYPDLPKWEPPAPLTQPSSFAPALSQTTWNFGSNDKPLEPSTWDPAMLTQEKVAHISDPALYNPPVDADPFAPAENGFVDQIRDSAGFWPNEIQHQTIPPSQIEETLARSFGHYQETQPDPYFDAAGPSPPQDARSQYAKSRSASQVISLLSDDEEEEEQQASAPAGYAPMIAQLATTNGGAREPEDGDGTFGYGRFENHNAEVPDSYQYTQHQTQYSNNPYAVLAGEYRGDTEDDGEVNLEDEEELEEEDTDVDAAPATNGHRFRSENADDDEEGDIGDTEEDYDEEEEYDDEEEGQGGPVRTFRSHHRADEEGEEEGFDSDDYDEEDEEEDEEPRGVFPNAGRWPAQSAKDPALQMVGNTEEEAIELSD